MTHAYAIHGEIAGRVGGGFGAFAENFYYARSSSYGDIQFATSPVRTNGAGNGGKYSISLTEGQLECYGRPRPVCPNSSFRESLHRISFRAENSSRFRLKLYLRSPEGSTLSPYWYINLDNHMIEVFTNHNRSNTRRHRSYPFTGVGIWYTLWVYARLSTTVEGAGGTQNADGRIVVYLANPRQFGVGPVLDFTGTISYADNNGVVDGTPGHTSIIRIQHRDDYIDDCVGHIPSMTFVSSTSSLPAYNDVIKYTDGSGNVITAIVTNAHQTGTDGSGNATGILTLTHMIYTPSGGTAVDFNGLDWGGVTQPWGTGSVSITDASGNALGTGTFDYKTSTFPQDGVFMPVAKPITTTATTLTPVSGTAADAHLQIDDFGGQTYPSTYLTADTSGQYWTGEFDDDTTTGTDKLNVSGTVEVRRVLSYVYGRQDGAGSAVTGKVTHYNLVTGNPLSSKMDVGTFQFYSYNGPSVFEHPESATSVAGTTTPWTVAAVNAASFGFTVD